MSYGRIGFFRVVFSSSSFISKNMVDALVTSESVVCVWWNPRHCINLHRIIFQQFFVLLFARFEHRKKQNYHKSCENGKFRSIVAELRVWLRVRLAECRAPNQDKIIRWQFRIMQTIHFFLPFVKFTTFFVCRCSLFACRRVDFSLSLFRSHVSSTENATAVRAQVKLIKRNENSNFWKRKKKRQIHSKVSTMYDGSDDEMPNERRKIKCGNGLEQLSSTRQSLKISVLPRVFVFAFVRLS